LFRIVYYCLLIWLPCTATAQLRKPYGKPTRWAATVELGGLSPLISINGEYAVIQSTKSFITIRGGVGQLFTGYSWLTLPHALTWNKVLNGKIKGCPPGHPRNSLFAELGIGGVYLAGATEKIKYRWSPIIGVRHYFAYNPRASGFWKAQLTPVVAGRFVPWGGIGIGLLID
jgi:hypothetical protein